MDLSKRTRFLEQQQLPPPEERREKKNFENSIKLKECRFSSAVLHFIKSHRIHKE